MLLKILWTTFGEPIFLFLNPRFSTRWWRWWLLEARQSGGGEKSFDLSALYFSTLVNMVKENTFSPEFFFIMFLLGKRVQRAVSPGAALWCFVSHKLICGGLFERVVCGRKKKRNWNFIMIQSTLEALSNAEVNGCWLVHAKLNVIEQNSHVGLL